MSRNIDADALIRRWCGIKCGCERDECGRGIEPCIVVMAIEEAPTIDRPQGEWIPCTKGGLPLTELGRRERQKWYGYKCSKCNFIYKGNALTESPFCQNCGARMKGADDDIH